MDLDLDHAELMLKLRAEIEARAHAALELWEAWPREQDAPGYTFEKTENPRPTLDVDIVGGAFVLTITGPQVEFFERGNAPKDGSAKITPRHGRYMLVQRADGGVAELASVDPYEGTDAWLKSVRAALLGD